MGKPTGGELYDLKVETGATYQDLADRFGETRDAIRGRVKHHYDGNNLPPPDKARIIGGLDEEPRSDGHEEWKRAIKIQERHKVTEERRESMRIIYPAGLHIKFFMADLHLGGLGVNYSQIDRDIRLIGHLADEGFNVSVTLAGDLIDNMIVGKLQKLRMNSSPFLVVEEWALVDYALERLAPYIDSSVAGNHDNWSWAVAGVDLLRERHHRLTPGILYDPFELAFTLQVGESETRIIVRHSWKGNSIYNPTHGLEQKHLTRGRDADVYVGGHTHRGGLAREIDNGGKVGYALLCGTYKDDDEYGSFLGLPPTLPTAAVALVLDETGVLDATSNIYALPRLLS